MIDHFFLNGKKRITAALILGCIFIYSCENDQKVINDLTRYKEMKEEAKDIESFLSQDGKLKAKLKAPLMYRINGDTVFVEFPKSLHVDFYNDSATVETWLDSRYGKYFEVLNKVYLRDSVVVINAGGDTLLAQDLWWDQNARLFYTDKYAEYHSKDKHIYPSKGIEATQDLSSIIFKYPTGTARFSENGTQQ